MKELHVEEPHELKNEGKVVRRFRLSILDELRLYAEFGSMGKAAKKLGEDRGNLNRRINKFKDDWPLISMVVDAVRKERLLEKTSIREALKKARESKVRRAEQGFYMKTRLTGYKVRDGELFEREDEIKRVKGMLHDFRVLMKGPAELAKKYKFPLSTVHRILRQPEYKGESVFMGKTYTLDTEKGDWKPRITPEQYDEIQSMLHAPKGGYRLSKILYSWKGGKWVAKPGAKELANKIVDKRLEGKSGATIAKELEISRSLVDKVLKDRRVTGTNEFESLVDIDKWKRARKVHVPTYQELEQKRSADRKRKIMTHVPAYRWEIREKMGLSKIIVNNLIADLKKDMLKERDDGLLQRAWEPFPEKVLPTRRRPESKRIKKFLELLQTEKKLTLVELRQKTGLSKPGAQRHISRLRKMGVVERPDYWGYRIKDDWVEYVATWLSQPHIAKL